eukprot:TRINITY_DN55503_c0_g1_i1.p1 TRINITY_DN55503_c0_g1~~TRINITY_DN55503_c0_g1_i1.p1  ORF type:complete len:596 (+),score=257.78 TRINITY_DN55503_c0_g1_i1:96-1883(+)
MAARSRSPAPGGWDLVSCMRRYVDRMVSEKGLKILLVDEETSGMLSMVCSFNEILQKDLYLLERLSNPSRSRQGHLKAIVFVRPTQENIDLLRQELQNPLYGEYFLFFSNVLDPRHLEQLAARDSHEVVKQVQELYGDYYAQHPYLFTCDMPQPLLHESAWTLDVTGRVTDSIVAALLALRKRPLLRYQGNSPIATRLAGRVAERMQEQQELFASERKDDSVILFVDRKDDAVTPLLTQWTYEAMVHNEFGVRRHCCTVPASPVAAEEETLNLTPLYDPFYKDNVHSNWGDYLENVQALKLRYREKSQLSAGVKQGGKNLDIEDIKRIMHQMPDLRKEGILVSKHVSLALQLQHCIKSRQLLEVSEREQEIACNGDFREDERAVGELLANPQVDVSNALRLVMIFALRHERNRGCGEALAQFKDRLRSREVPDEALRLVDRITAWAGASQRASDLFEDGSGLAGEKAGKAGLLSKAKMAGRAMKRAVGAGKEVENVYTQHLSLIKRNAELLFEGRLPTDIFPYFGQGGPQGFKTREIIIFFCGGVTHEEVRQLVEMLQERDEGPKRELRWPGAKVLMGSTDILRTEQFMEHLRQV